MIFSFTQEDFHKLLNQFQESVNKGEYTEKVPYDIWRRLKKLSHPNVGYVCSTITIHDNDVLLFTDKTYDDGFGRFFYNNYIKERTSLVRTDL